MWVVRSERCACLPSNGRHDVCIRTPRPIHKGRHHEGHLANTLWQFLHCIIWPSSTFTKDIQVKKLHPLTQPHCTPYFGCTSLRSGIRNMASASHVQLEASRKSRYCARGLPAKNAKIASELMQVNHEKHQTFFNNNSFYNHIAHYLLIFFALSATAVERLRGYDTNVSCQRPLELPNDSIVDGMHKPDHFETYLGK